jgi:LuxR family maltose regulon positive regulatory protein
MPRHANRRTPVVVSGILYTDDAHNGLTVDSPAWLTWLVTATTFYYDAPVGGFTVHYEHRQRGGSYWIAYRRRAGILHRTHLGKPDHLTRLRLDEVALILSR